jgi:Secretion system C-terminal sorting domain
MRTKLFKGIIIVAALLINSVALFSETVESNSSSNPLPMDKGAFASNYSISGNKSEIKIVGEVGKSATTKIFSSQGKLVGEFQLANQNENTIKLAQLSTGFYIIEIQTETGTTIQKFFI